MRISEIYPSIQGEGRLTGVESIFVRTSGCNLRCDFCDTPYTSWQPEGDDQSIEEILSQVAAYTCDHVVLTGGEPMLFSELIPLTKALRAIGKHITIETAGTLYLPLECDLMSISPKLANSTPSAQRDARWHVRHEQSRHVPEVICALISQYEYQLKFVVETLVDCAEVESYLLEFPKILRANVQLMPQGTDQVSLAKTAAWLQPYCEAHGLQFCPRRQIEWFGFTRGT